MFEKIRRFYNLHIYTKDMVKKFVEKDVITPEQYEEITGEKYEEA